MYKQKKKIKNQIEMIIKQKNSVKNYGFSFIQKKNKYFYPLKITKNRLFKKNISFIINRRKYWWNIFEKNFQYKKMFIKKEFFYINNYIKLNTLKNVTFFPQTFWDYQNKIEIETNFRFQIRNLLLQSFFWKYFKKKQSKQKNKTFYKINQKLKNTTIKKKKVLKKKKENQKKKKIFIPSFKINKKKKAKTKLEQAFINIHNYRFKKKYYNNQNKKKNEKFKKKQPKTTNRKKNSI